MSETAKTEQSAKLNSVVDTIISKIPQEREKEIISRRFGLYDRKETLELIGDMFGITRERVRQLEKAILTRLRAAVAEGELPSVIAMEKKLLRVCLKWDELRVCKIWHHTSSVKKLLQLTALVWRSFLS